MSDSGFQLKVPADGREALPIEVAGKHQTGKQPGRMASKYCENKAFTVIVAGGGAAGMMAAAAAAQKGSRVILYEKNEKLGKKVYITGKGRCNVTNDCDMEELFQNVVTNAKFLYSAFYGFSNHAVMEWLEAAGCPLKTERGGRVFPVSDHASDVIRAFSRKLAELGVEIHLNTGIHSLLTEEEPAAPSGRRVTGVLLEDGSAQQADAVIIACGGLSYPTTGSTGDGYRMAGSLGHTCVPCTPSLVPFHLKEEWSRSLQGLALKNTAVNLIIGGKKVYEGFGELLFTHFGISGPLILSASSYYKKALDQASKKKAKTEKALQIASDAGNSAERQTQAILRMDLKPALDEEQLDRRILRDFEDNKNRQFKNAVEGLFPARLVPVMIQLSGIPPEKKVHDITREERQKFVHCIKGLEVTVTGTRGYEEAIITKGGISVKEVNPSTMESRLAPGLYLAGEMLDLDALTGGFNLQIAWSTGFLAGESAVKSLG